MSEKQKDWNGVERRRTAAQVAEQAETDLEKHVVECSARYIVLKNQVESQGEQIAKIDETVGKIDDKLDNLAISFNASVDTKLDKIKEEMAVLAKGWSDKWNDALLWLLGACIAIIGWGIEHYIIK
ncbi:hypothetical protein BG58_11030 [Caballeronia jiangsuensis]|nr:hypothetical protein BG58_11030 [Caballeronia jiangsuensis]